MITSKEYKCTYYICIKHGTSRINRFNCNKCRKDKIIKMFSLELLLIN